MQNSECGIGNKAGTARSRCAGSRRVHVRHSALRIPHSAFCNRPAFTLVELLVALALMSILLTMIAQIFFRAGKTVGMARASIEVHQNARAAFDMMLRDLAAAQLCNYADRLGYFALTDVDSQQAMTFTTLATQDGTTPLAQGVSPQLCLVRYCLESSGKPVQTDKNQAPRQVYYLVKKVRYPSLTDTTVNMDVFDNATLPERAAYQALTPPAEPVSADVLALGILDMQIRVLYGPRSSLDTGAPPTVWYWSGATATSVTQPTWIATRPSYIERRSPMTSANSVRMPALVEVTLEMTDRFGTRTFTFTERFYLPASAW